MHILMLSDVYFPRVNGVSSSLRSFRDGLIGRGIRVSLLAPAYGAAREEFDDPDLVRIAGRPIPGDPEDRLMSATRCTRIGERRVPDLIHIHTPFAAHVAGIRIARRFRIPVISTYHTLFEEYAQHYVPWLPPSLLRSAARLASRHQCRQVDTVIVPSSALRERLSGYGIRQPMQILPTGIPVTEFAHGNREAFRDFLRVPPETTVALFVGRTAHEKNIAFLLQVARCCQIGGPEMLFVIAGEGPALGSLKALAVRLGISHRVRFVGYLERPWQLADCYAAADVFVFASKTETQGLVLAEALAAGLPIVALSAMGTRDLLEGNAAAVIAPDDPRGFADHLLALARNPRRRQSMAVAARQAALAWREETQLDRLVELYRSLLRHPAGEDLPVDATAPAGGA